MALQLDLGLRTRFAGRVLHLSALCLLFLLSFADTSVTCAYICWLFGGLFGAHRFLVGRPVSGFVWMFTLGLFGVGWLIDALLLPQFVEEHNKRVFNRLMMETSSVFFDGDMGTGASFYPQQPHHHHHHHGGGNHPFAGAVAPYAANVYFPAQAQPGAPNTGYSGYY